MIFFPMDLDVSPKKGAFKTRMKPKAGTYVLVLESKISQCVQIGRLDTLAVKPGYYLYVGSAFGPGGVKARVLRHSRGSPRSHWHIDYLRRILTLIEVWYSYDKTPREHRWAEIMSLHRGFTSPVRSFGASDCSCVAHLFYSKRKPSGSGFRQKVRRAIVDHDRIMIERL